MRNEKLALFGGPKAIKKSFKKVWSNLHTLK